MTTPTPSPSVPASVLQRLQETFRRLSTGSGYLPQLTFTRDVLGDSVPPKLVEVRVWVVMVHHCDNVSWFRPFMNRLEEDRKALATRTSCVVWCCWCMEHSKRRLAVSGGL